MTILVPVISLSFIELLASIFAIPFLFRKVSSTPKKLLYTAIFAAVLLLPLIILGIAYHSGIQKIFKAFFLIISFNAFLCGFYYFIIGISRSSYISTIIISIAGLLILSFPISLNLVWDSAYNISRNSAVFIATSNPLIVISGSVFGYDMLRTGPLYNLCPIGSLYFKYPYWLHVTAIYLIAAFILLSSGALFSWLKRQSQH
jgi:hypothetical protein